MTSSVSCKKPLSNVNNKKPKLTNHYKTLAGLSLPLSNRLSNYFNFKSHQQQKVRIDSEKASQTGLQTCSYCSSPFNASNKIQHVPKSKLTPKLQKLLQRCKDGQGSLGKYQQNLVDRYFSSGSKWLIRCSVCQYTTQKTGQSRLQRQKQREQQHRVILAAAAPACVPRTKTEKKKEKKKLMKKRRKAAEEEHAGLNMPALTKDIRESLDTDGNTSTHQQQKREEHGFVLSTIDSGLIRATSPSVGSNSHLKPNKQSCFNVTKSSKQLTVLPSKSPDINPKAVKGKTMKDKTVTGLQSITEMKRPASQNSPAQGHGNLSHWSTGRLGKCYGRNKKKLAQQLGEMLKQKSEEKQEPSSLSEFLCSL